MSTVITEAAVDVVVLGLGVMGGAVAAELSTAGYKVAGIEKGPYYQFADDFAPVKYDEWGIMVMRKFDHPLRVSTFTMRQNGNQFAPPVRRNTPTDQVISLGHAVGGMAQHYAGDMGRYGPWAYQMASETASRYGANFISGIEPHQDVEDWPMQYTDYEPYYVAWEQSWGIAGTNEGPLLPMSKNYPLPPHPDTAVGTAFKNACEAVGYSPFPTPSALASQPYTNQYGVQVNPCVYDGWCTEGCNYVCETGAKANSAYRTVPAAIKSGNFTLALNSYVFRLDTNSQGLITAARYYDAEGNVHVQPAKVFFNGLWGFNIIRSMLLSGLGNPYDPSTVTGSLGRGITEADLVGPFTLGTINIGANGYPAGNGSGGQYNIRDLADDNFDHTGLNFIGGLNTLGVGGYAGSGPGFASSYYAAASPANIGSKYKAGWKDYYLKTSQTVSIFNYTNQLPRTDYYSDLDPHYTDIYGDPLERVTLDFGVNEFNTSNYLVPKMQAVLEKMGCSNVFSTPSVTPGSVHVDAWQAHTRGGARLGVNSATSVFNKWQQSWTTENLFAAGEICNTTGNNMTAGTHGAGYQAYVAAEGIKMYLTSPGELATSM
jgi:gluconate 2-dehydrogenase alpha chain